MKESISNKLVNYQTFSINNLTDSLANLTNLPTRKLIAKRNHKASFG